MKVVQFCSDNSCLKVSSPRQLPLGTVFKTIGNPNAWLRTDEGFVNLGGNSFCHVDKFLGTIDLIYHKARVVLE